MLSKLPVLQAVNTWCPNFRTLTIVKLLAEGNQIPEEYNPHPLKGNWKNYMECHIENDTLLIWFDKNNNAIELVRLGSHSELFGKGRKR